VAKSNRKAKLDPFISIPRDVLKSEAFKSLPAVYRALYLDLRRQGTPWQNGRITASDSTLEVFGWSHSTIHKGLGLLIEHGLLERTRRGGLGDRGKKCSLYAFTDMAVEPDEARGIRARPPTYAYRTYRPTDAARKTDRCRKSKVHLMDRFGSHDVRKQPETVHRMDEARNEGSPCGPCDTAAGTAMDREKIAA
jgi:hypothetical protein